MGELINLRRVKKAAERAAKEKTAAANRTTHGTPRRLRKIAKAEKLRADHTVDTQKLDCEKRR